MILIPGGCGYIGAMLVPHLLADGHKVTVFDTMMFGGGGLPKDNGNLTVIKGDVRDEKAFAEACEGQDAVIYLASISSNDLCTREPELAFAVNIGAMFAVPRIAHKAGVKRFIYASSVAGYPPGDEPAKETQALGHPTPYALGKLCAEGSVRGQCNYVIVRCASVCGYSPRMRFDVTVNKMTHDAIRYGEITVNGGDQKRSHVHILDVCAFYKRLLTAESAIGETFNLVAENHSVLEMAEIVAEVTGAKITRKPHTDLRSYSVDGTKAREVLDFCPKYPVRYAVSQVKAHFECGCWKDSTTNKRYQNIV